MKKKTLALIGMIVAAVMFLCGLLVMVGAFGGDTTSASGAGYLYDSGYATFGADFYNYVTNNAAEAASASRTAAGNLDDIATLLKNVCGVFLMGIGAMAACGFGMVFFACKAQEVPAAAYPPPFVPFAPAPAPAPFAPAPFAPEAPAAPFAPEAPAPQQAPNFQQNQF